MRESSRTFWNFNYNVVLKWKILDNNYNYSYISQMKHRSFTIFSNNVIFDSLREPRSIYNVQSNIYQSRRYVNPPRLFYPKRPWNVYIVQSSKCLVKISRSRENEGSKKIHEPSSTTSSSAKNAIVANRRSFTWQSSNRSCRSATRPGKHEAGSTLATPRVRASSNKLDGGVNGWWLRGKINESEERRQRH